MEVTGASLRSRSVHEATLSTRDCSEGGSFLPERLLSNRFFR